MLRVLQLLGRVAPTQASVLITGESGTGKELIAEALHRNSPRADRAFVKVNLGGISSSLFESEMFGHVRGAFTDARADRKGRFELAHGGTIFLDEIGDLDPASQVKMLRVLQDRTFEVLGSSQRREVDVRVVSATNRALPDMVARGEFREDLLYRINLITVAPAAASRAARRHPAARLALPAGRGGGVRPRGRGADTGGGPLAAGAAVAGQRAAAPAGRRAAVLVDSRDRLDVESFTDLAAAPGHEPAGDSLPDVGAMTIDEIERAMILKSLRHHGGNSTLAPEPDTTRASMRAGVNDSIVTVR